MVGALELRYFLMSFENEGDICNQLYVCYKFIQEYGRSATKSCFQPLSEIPGVGEMSCEKMKNKIVENGQG